MLPEEAQCVRHGDGVGKREDGRQRSKWESKANPFGIDSVCYEAIIEMVYVCRLVGLAMAVPVLQTHFKKEW